MSKRSSQEKQEKASGSCPHCGQSLSPWEQVLLSVDRALTCRHCWYRIYLDVGPKPPNRPPGETPPSKEHGS